MPSGGRAGSYFIQKDGAAYLERSGWTLEDAALRLHDHRLRVSTHSDGWDGLAIDYLDRGAFESYWRRVMESDPGRRRALPGPLAAVPAHR